MRYFDVRIETNKEFNESIVFHGITEDTTIEYLLNRADSYVYANETREVKDHYREYRTLCNPMINEEEIQMSSKIGEIVAKHHPIVITWKYKESNPETKFCSIIYSYIDDFGFVQYCNKTIPLNHSFSIVCNGINHLDVYFRYYEDVTEYEVFSVHDGTQIYRGGYFVRKPTMNWIRLPFKVRNGEVLIFKTKLKKMEVKSLIRKELEQL